MPRPREFDRDEALQKAIQVFWRHGFAATSTDLLVKAMDIGRQSLYNTFGDKRQLYLEALKSYQARTLRGHLARLSTPESPLEGIRQLLVGLAAQDDDTRALGCMGVGAVGEFGASDPALLEQRTSIQKSLGKRIQERLVEGQKSGEIDASLSARKAAAFVQMAMTGLQLAARSGAEVKSMHDMANFTVDRLKAI